MRACLLLPSLLIGGLLASACETAPAPAAPVLVERDLPDYRPETAAACNAVQMRVELSAAGTLAVNGEETTLPGMLLAAKRKNEACANAPAMVLLAVAQGTPERDANLTREALARSITNLTLIETIN